MQLYSSNGGAESYNNELRFILLIWYKEGGSEFIPVKRREMGESGRQDTPHGGY